jgi:hypothetical protein
MRVGALSVLGAATKGSVTDLSAPIDALEADYLSASGTVSYNIWLNFSLTFIKEPRTVNVPKFIYSLFAPKIFWWREA